MAATWTCRSVVGTENERAVDISKLRAKTGYITLDEGYMNTGSTTSAITFLDGEAGILRYRGYPIEQLAENCDFIEVTLPAALRRIADRRASLENFRNKLRRHTMLHEDMRLFYDGFPRDAHPMAILQLRVRRALDVLSGFAQRHRSGASQPLGPAADGQAADDRGLRLQEVDRPAVRLSAERSDVLRELPADDVRGADASRSRPIRILSTR